MPTHRLSTRFGTGSRHDAEPVAKYRLETQLNRPRHRVVPLFDNPDNLTAWQPDLLEFDILSGIPGQVGAKTRVFFRRGKRQIEMTESVISRNLPDEITFTDEIGDSGSPDRWNNVRHHFVELEGNKTLWQFDSEFRCSGFMKLMCLLPPGQFKKESRKHMAQFRDFVEKS